MRGEEEEERSVGKKRSENKCWMDMEWEDTYSATVLVENLPESIISAFDTASRVPIRPVIAVLVQYLPRLLPLHSHSASLRRVQRHLISRIPLIDCLNDIDLAVFGPVRLIGQPQSGPGTASVGGVHNVEDEEAAVVLLLRGEADGMAAVWSLGGAVDTEDVGGRRGRVGQVCGRGIGF